MKRSASEGADEHYLRFVRGQPCCAPTIVPCRSLAPQNAHHPRIGVGLSLKAADRQAIALCWLHHQCLHSLRGPFEHFNRAMLRAWQLEQVDRHQRRYASVRASLEQRGDPSDDSSPKASP